MGATLADSGKIVPAVTCWITANDKVLLMKRSKDSKHFPEYFIGPGGFIDLDEDCLTAAIREIAEETGIILKADCLKLRAVGISRHIDKKETFIIFIYLVKLEEIPSIIESTEGTLEWVNINDLNKYKLLPGFAYYQKHVLSDNTDILYANLELENLNIKKVSSIRISQS